MRKLVGAVLALGFIVGCEDNYDRRVDRDRDRTTVIDRDRDTTTTMREDTTVRDTVAVDLRYKVTRIDREKNQVILTTVEPRDMVADDVQRTAGRELTLSFAEFKTKASFTGDINTLKEGDEFTLKNETATTPAPAKDATNTDVNKTDTKTDDTTTRDKTY